MASRQFSTELARRDAAETLTIIGASTRAAAESARRGFFLPVAGDLFADLDLSEAGPTTRVEDYPHGLESVLRGQQAGGWLYTGALENYPDLIERWSAIRPLYGNRAEVLRRVRNPLEVARCLGEADLPCPNVALSSDSLPPDGSWLRKPTGSAGGSRIAPWTTDIAGQACDYPVYFQRLITGTPCSAVYVAADGAATLLGVTRQLLVEAFRYQGSVGPTLLDPTTCSQWQQLGQQLSADFDLVGLFGIDAVVNDAGIWPVEINPRYTASMEVLERALGISAVAMHVKACVENLLPSAIPAAKRIVGKAIYFAEQDLVIDRDLRSEIDDIADVPQIGSLISVSSPVMTVLRSGCTEQEVLQSLDEALQEFNRLTMVK